MKRNYKIKFRITIGDETDKKSDNFLKYYMPKWSQFMKIIMARKLLSLPTVNTASVKELPGLRKLIKKDVDTKRLIGLMSSKDPELSRLLLEVSPLFDAAPNDLKVHILAAFGISESELQKYLSIF
jgi:hypothetical protein